MVNVQKGQTKVEIITPNQVIFNCSKVSLVNCGLGIKSLLPFSLLANCGQLMQVIWIKCLLLFAEVLKLIFLGSVMGARLSGIFVDVYLERV